MTRILSIGTSLPRHRYTQQEIKRAYAGMFQGQEGLKHYLPIFDRAGVGARHFAKPLSYYKKAPEFSQRNADYLETAMELSLKAARESLRLAKTSPQEIGYFVSATTTGLATPSLDARIAGQLGLPSDVKRNPIFGTGCASGAVALARAGEFLKANPKSKALLLSVELCSLTLQRRDFSVENRLACALFSDGAAAAVLGAGNSSGPRLAACESHLFPDSTKVMGWEFGTEGMKIILSPEVPAIVRGKLPSLIKNFLHRNGLSISDLRHWILHPGGMKVIEAYEEVFGLTPLQTKWSRECLKNWGNLSSASILFMLKDLMRSNVAKPGDAGLLVALGPGFAAEMALLKW